VQKMAREKPDFGFCHKLMFAFLEVPRAIAALPYPYRSVPPSELLTPVSVAVSVGFVIRFAQLHVNAPLISHESRTDTSDLRDSVFSCAPVQYGQDGF
jgi:hypothetical protein